jgi:hypothetical protein
MAGEPTREWREPSPGQSDEEALSLSDESTSYKEEVLTLTPKKKGHIEEEDDPTYMPKKTGPSTQNSRILAKDDEGRISK